VKRPHGPGLDEALHAGRELFESICAPCHGVRGEGQPSMAPPLYGSEWVSGPLHRLVRIALYGLEGPVRVRGETYEPPRVMPNMPGVDGLSEDQMSVLLTFVYDAFGPGGTDVSPELIRRVRAKEGPRVRAYAEAELLAAEPIEPPTPPKEATR
jgi:mono/diheme cytochrome c family protein